MGSLEAGQKLADTGQTHYKYFAPPPFLNTSLALSIAFSLDLQASGSFFTFQILVEYVSPQNKNILFLDRGGLLTFGKFSSETIL